MKGRLLKRVAGVLAACAIVASGAGWVLFANEGQGGACYGHR